MNRALPLAAMLLIAGGLAAADGPSLLQSGCVFGGNNDPANTADLAMPDGDSHGLLLVRIQADSGTRTPVSVSYDGIALKALLPTRTADSGFLQTWYLAQPPSDGSHPLEVDCKDGFHGHSWNVVEEVYCGVDTADPFGAKAHGLFRESATWKLKFKTRFDRSVIDDFLEVADNPSTFVPSGDQVLDEEAPWCGGGASVNRGDHMDAPKAGTYALGYALDTPKTGAYQILEIRGAP
ncbi:MAG TPA: hypothetical protein VK914_04090 [bacterium]|jgi:hypothetical protein|nr:hypothetical protein [bacterium]